jgi:hypothetical protein
MNFWTKELKLMKIFIWIVRIIAAGIFITNLIFKFFWISRGCIHVSTLGMEPTGRISSELLNS